MLSEKIFYPNSPQ